MAADKDHPTTSTGSGGTRRSAGGSGGRPGEASPPSLRDKVAFLSSRDAYRPRPSEVEAIETHMSWVFLSDRYAYKLKKPIRYDVLDFSTPERRQRSCRREIRLNRRLAPEVYLDVLPLTVEPDGRLRIGGSGQSVDWLVKMKRLPESRMLDRLIREERLERETVEPVAALLADFYAHAVAAPVDGVGYREHLREGIRADLDELVKPTYGMPAGEVRRIAEEQLAWVDEASDVLERRVSQGRVVEGHGDLRPEHICLTDPPAVIDCLEFSRDLRILDPLDELSFLALECLRLGAPEVGEWFLEVYSDVTGDEAMPDLLRFYRRFRALRRAKVAVWHLRDPTMDSPEKWRGRAEWYLTRGSDGSAPA